MTISDAADREVAFLVTTGDGLPSLLATVGGPWGTIERGWPSRLPTRDSGLYLMRLTVTEQRFSNARKLVRHDFQGRAWWPLGTSGAELGDWQAEQAALDTAVDLLIQRIRGTVGDHTHGGRFLSVAEAPDPGRIVVRFADPEVTATASPPVLRADISYSADDTDFTG